MHVPFSRKLAGFVIAILTVVVSPKAVTLFSCPAGSAQCALDMTNPDYAMLTEAQIWVEGTNATPGKFSLRLEDTNPTFFALVFNALKDQKDNDHHAGVRIYYRPNFSGASGTYNKIVQIAVQ